MKNIALKSTILMLFGAISFFLGFATRAMNIDIELDRRPQQLRGKTFTDIGSCYTHNKILLDFYLKHKRGVGFAAIRQEHFSFEGPLIVYLITEDGKFSAFIEEKGMFRNTYRKLKSNSFIIGYENEGGSFVEIDTEEFNAVDLQIAVDLSTQ